MRPIRPKSQIDRVPTRNAAKREGSGEGRHCRRQEGRLLGQEGVLLCCRCRCLRRSCFLPRGVWYDRLHFTLEDSMKLLTLFKMLRTCVTRETCGAKLYEFLEMKGPGILCEKTLIWTRAVIANKRITNHNNGFP
nr:PREDICTED: uncharacterized protein LOC103968777 isoform X1 [Musa acuminata subsp. malaccensis]